MPLGAARLNFLAKTQAEAVTRNAVEMTAYGNAQTSTAQSKFGGASAYFDGATGTYVNGALSLTDTFKWATFTDYTLEFWFYVNDLNSLSNSAGTLNPRTIGNMDPTGNANYWSFGPTHTGQIGLNYFTGSVFQVYSTTGLLSTSTWYHTAMVKNGTSIKHYLDGTEVASATLSGTPQYDNTIGLNIGQYGHSTIGGTIDAYIDELRISDTARYTSSFTAPTSAFTNDANTLLLMHMNGPNVTAVNQAQKDTDIKKFGNASLLLDGTNDRLELSGDYSQTGDFTAECWFYPTSTSGTRCLFAIGDETSDRQFVNVQGSNLYTDEFGAGGVDINGTGGAITINNWHHGALVREGTTVSLYLNGSRVGTTTSSATIGNANNLYIGTLSDGAVDFVGNIDEFRLSDTARYSGASYTVPTSGFTHDANTVALLHMDGSDTGTGFTFEDDTISS